MHSSEWSPVLEPRSLSDATDILGDDDFGGDATPSLPQRRARNGQVVQEPDHLRVDPALQASETGWGQRDGHACEQPGRAERRRQQLQQQQVEGEQSHPQREAAEANSEEREQGGATMPRGRGMRQSPSTPSLSSLSTSRRRDEASIAPAYLRKRQTWPAPGALWGAVVRVISKPRIAAAIEPAPRLPMPRIAVG